MKRKPEGAKGERCVGFQILDAGRFGDRLSWRRIYSAPGVPECNNFEKRAADPVVDEIPNARQVKPSNHFRARCFHLGADARLFDEQGQGGLDIHAHSPGSGKTIDGPPLCCALNLALSARFNTDA